jgi:transaldolase
MTADYFHRLHKETPTHFWINNPTAVELDKAIAAGAVSCTTNPAYCSKLITAETAYLHSVIDEVIRTTRDDEQAAIRVYQRTCQRLMKRFQRLYELSGGRCGFVTMQDDPRLEHDPDAIIRCVLENRKLGPNYMAKIPVVAGGMEAIETCVAENIPICATEIFTLTQAIEICERYQRAAARTGNHPAFFVTHISGIFDEYVEKVAKRERLTLSPEALRQGGCAIARKEYALLKQRGYAGILLGGGARGTHHFLELVGGTLDVTINWSTAQEILDANPPLVSRIDAEPDPRVIKELNDKVPAFRQCYAEDGLPPEKFADFGPVQLFRNAFLKGWYLLLAEVVARRNALAL